MSRKTTPKICQYCQRKFMALVTEIKRNKAKYCSISCGVAFRNKSKSLATHEVFFSKISKEINTSGCWIYSVGKRYAKLDVNGKTILAHRYSYELYKGKIPEGMLVCHKCDIPLCVNPNHLFLGTSKDNCHDMLKKKRGNHRKGSTHPHAQLNEKQIARIKRRIINGEKIHHLKDEYKVKRELLYQMKAGKSWNHVEPEDSPT